MNDLWLCLRFPQLPLDQLQAGDDVALAIVEQQRIAFVSPAAQSAGLEAGMSLSTALALCPTLHSVKRERDSETRVLRQLAHWCYQFSPCVSLRAAQPDCPEGSANDTILLEISRCLRLFHGLDALLHTLCDGLLQKGYRALASLAHTPQGAWILGLEPELNPLDECGQVKPDAHRDGLDGEACLRRLQAVPLPRLPLSERQQQRLHNLGLGTLGEVLELPRASLARRLGKPLVTRLDKICGRAPDLQLCIQPQQQFVAERHYLSGLTSVAMLQHPLTELLQELHRFLLAGQLQCQGFRWRFVHVDRHTSELAIELATAQNQADNFERLSRLKLEAFRIPAPIETVQLHSNALVASQARSQALFPELGQQAQEDRYQLLDILRTRLGHDAIYRLQCREEHLPEYRQTCVSPSPEKETAPAAGSLQPLPHGPPQPLWLLPRPEPLRDAPGDSLISGSQRIDSHWWQRHQQRSYFIARDEQGCRWLFYDVERRRWFVHGYFG